MKLDKPTFKGISLFVGVCFFVQAILPSFSFAQELLLPKPTEFVYLSSAYSFPVLKGMRFDPSQPLKMEFVIDPGDQKEVNKKEATQLIRYFLCGLTIPEEDIWVNMSPYEEDRITTLKLAETDLGRDLLAQDYILKQLSSSLVYPETETGKDYWQKVYREVLKIANTTIVPVNTFNKIWITPDEAEVYENEKGNFVLVTKASLKAMLEEDYLALSKNQEEENARCKVQGAWTDSARWKVQGARYEKTKTIYPAPTTQHQEIHKTASEIMRSIILPKINQDVNYGKNFANLRQIYHSLILAVWFKKKFKESVYRYYIDQNKTKGIDLEDKSTKEKIYNTYLEAFTKGLYNYIKTETEPVTRKKIKRQYFSGGTVMDLSRLRKFVVPDRKILTRAPSVINGVEISIIPRTVEVSSPILFYSPNKAENWAKERIFGVLSSEETTKAQDLAALIIQNIPRELATIFEAYALEIQKGCFRYGDPNEYYGYIWRVPDEEKAKDSIMPLTEEVIVLLDTTATIEDVIITSLANFIAHYLVDREDYFGAWSHWEDLRDALLKDRLGVMFFHSACRNAVLTWFRKKFHESPLPADWIPLSSGEEAFSKLTLIEADQRET